MPSLTVTEPGKEPRTVVLGPEPLVIGRSPTKCGLTFDFLGLSGRHCQIVQTGETFKLVDLESANHTFVNNREIIEHYLNHGDRIVLGVIILTYNNELQPQPANAKPRSSATTPAAPVPETYNEPTFIMDGQKLRKKMEQLRSGKVEAIDDTSDEAGGPKKSPIGATAKDYANAASAAAAEDGTAKVSSAAKWQFFGLGFMLAFALAFALGMVFKILKF